MSRIVFTCVTVLLTHLNVKRMRNPVLVITCLYRKQIAVDICGRRVRMRATGVVRTQCSDTCRLEAYVLIRNVCNRQKKYRETDVFLYFLYC